MRTKRNSTDSREPLSSNELGRLTPSEIARLTLTEDEKNALREINKSRQRERLNRSMSLKIEEASLVSDLHEVGCEVESVWDLVNSSKNYEQAVPVLLRHLLLPYSDRTREGIARSLAISTPEVEKSWSVFADEYRRAPVGWGGIAPGDTKGLKLGTKDALAVVLAAIATDETLLELIALAKDRNHGQSRVLLLSALRKSKNPLAKLAIGELVSDPGLMKEIEAW